MYVLDRKDLCTVLIKNLVDTVVRYVVVRKIINLTAKRLRPTVLAKLEVARKNFVFWLMHL